ncbi:hypothetical protein [Romboutsia sp.]|uniref:hypothetical protein n=1 Tax=Romboutsia sp. TaxID=1965302 RepID=UPI003F323EDF
MPDAEFVSKFSNFSMKLKPVFIFRPNAEKIKLSLEEKSFKISLGWNEFQIRKLIKCIMDKNKNVVVKGLEEEFGNKSIESNFKIDYKMFFLIYSFIGIIFAFLLFIISINGKSMISFSSMLLVLFLFKVAKYFSQIPISAPAIKTGLFFGLIIIIIILAFLSFVFFLIDMKVFHVIVFLLMVSSVIYFYLIICQKLLKNYWKKRCEKFKNLFEEQFKC